MQELFSDPIMFRGLERILIIAGGIFCIYLGYRLFLFGADRGWSNLTSESAFFKITFSGTGPGLFFMAFGAIILTTALFSGEGEVRSRDLNPKESVEAIKSAEENLLKLKMSNHEQELRRLRAPREDTTMNIEELRQELLKDEN